MRSFILSQCRDLRTGVNTVANAVIWNSGIVSPDIVGRVRVSASLAA